MLPLEGLEGAMPTASSVRNLIRLGLLVLALVSLAFAAPQNSGATHSALRDQTPTAGGRGGAALPSSSPITSICYASPDGNDASDGSSVRTAKQHVMACYDAIPAGDIILLEGINGSAVSACSRRDPPGCGIWIMGSGDSNYAHPPPGWRKEKAVHFMGGVGADNVPGSPAGRTHVLAGGSDRKHPAIWLSSTGQTTFLNVSVTACLPALVGTDSSGDGVKGAAKDGAFDNVGLWASNQVGCGPGMLVASSSSRTTIRHSQIEGSTLEHALVAGIVRRFHTVIFTAVDNLPSSWKTGMEVGIEGVLDPSFDGGDYRIKITGPKTFTYYQTGPDAESASGEATSDGDQAIVLNPHGAQGNSLYASDSSLYGGAIKVYAGSSPTVLEVSKVKQEQGKDATVWVANCTSPTVINAHDIRARDAASTTSVVLRSDCGGSPHELAGRTPVQNVAFEPPASPEATRAELPPKPTADQPRSTVAARHPSLSPPPAPRMIPERPVAALATKTLPLPSPRAESRPSTPADSTKLFGVQAGAFRDPANADELKAQLGTGYGPVAVIKHEGTSPFYRVIVGRESSPEAAREIVARLRRDNVAPSAFVVPVPFPALP